MQHRLAFIRKFYYFRLGPHLFYENAQYNVFSFLMTVGVPIKAQPLSKHFSINFSPNAVTLGIDNSS